MAYTVTYPSDSPHSPSSGKDGDADTVVLRYVSDDKFASGWQAELAVRDVVGTYYDHFGTVKPWLYAASFAPRYEGPGIWLVEIQYDQVGPEGDPEDDPLSARPKVSITSETLEIPVVETASEGDRKGGEPLHNSAGEYFDPPPTKQIVAYKINVERNLPISAPVLTQGHQYQMAVNTDVYFGVPPGHAQYRLTNVTEEIAPATEDREPYLYLKVTEEISINPDGFRLRVIDRGEQFINAEGLSETFKSPVDGTPRSGFLDGSGGRLWPVDDKGVEDRTADVVVLERQIYPELPFGPLGLPARFGE